MMGCGEVESHPLLYLIVGDDLALWVLLIGWSDFEPERDHWLDSAVAPTETTRDIHIFVVNKSEKG